MVISAIQEERFYMLMGSEFNPKIQKRMENILLGMNPA